MKKFIKVDKITDLDFPNMYQITYKKNGKYSTYNVASRRNLVDLECNSKGKVDAVRIVPYIIQDGNIQVVLIKEFRSAINKYIYSVPAGLVDGDEQCETSAIRELKEEIGAKVVSIVRTEKGSYSSAGMTDEKIECFEAEVELAYQQELEETEDITIQVVPLEEIIEFIDKNDFCIQSALMLKAFYYKKKLDNK